jgi:hypothetical protein
MKPSVRCAVCGSDLVRVETSLVPGRRDPYQAFGCVGNGSTTKTGKALARGLARLLSDARALHTKIASSDVELRAMRRLVAAAVDFGEAEAVHMKAMRDYDRAQRRIQGAMKMGPPPIVHTADVHREVRPDPPPATEPTRKHYRGRRPKVAGARARRRRDPR